VKLKPEHEGLDGPESSCDFEKWQVVYVYFDTEYLTGRQKKVLEKFFWGDFDFLKPLECEIISFFDRESNEIVVWEDEHKKRCVKCRFISDWKIKMWVIEALHPNVPSLLSAQKNSLWISLWTYEIEGFLELFPWVSISIKEGRSDADSIIKKCGDACVRLTNTL